MTNETLKILVVDDDPVSLQLVERTLNQSELNVAIKTAGTVGDALKSLADEEFDVAIVDYRLPDGTALSILKTFKKGSVISTPAIVLTAYAEKALALEAMGEGAQDFLLKENLTGDNLERAIRYAVQRSKLTNELVAANERIQQERELRLIKESVFTKDTAPPPAMAEDSGEFKEFAKEYREILERSLEETNFKSSRQVPSKLRSVAGRLGALGAGPKDVVNIHAAALNTVILDETKELASALSAEAKVLLVQLMGYLCDFYRSAQIRSEK